MAFREFLLVCLVGSYVSGFDYAIFHSLYFPHKDDVSTLASHYASFVSHPSNSALLLRYVFAGCICHRSEFCFDVKPNIKNTTKTPKTVAGTQLEYILSCFFLFFLCVYAYLSAALAIVGLAVSIFACLLASHPAPRTPQQHNASAQPLRVSIRGLFSVWLHPTHPEGIWKINPHLSNWMYVIWFDKHRPYRDVFLINTWQCALRPRPEEM